MMKSELEQSLKTTLSQIEELKKKAEEIIEELKKEEIPEYPKFEKGSTLYYMDVDFNVQADVFYGTEIMNDHNCFHSERYAEILSERSNYLAMLLHCKWYFDRDYVPDWDNCIENKWVIAFDHEYGKFVVYFWMTCDFGTIAFSSKEAAQKAADWLNSNGKGITR